MYSFVSPGYAKGHQPGEVVAFLARVATPALAYILLCCVFGSTYSGLCRMHEPRAGSTAARHLRTGALRGLWTHHSSPYVIGTPPPHRKESVRRQCLTGPRFVAAITQSVFGGCSGLLRGVAVWAAGYVSCPCHASITECHGVECECVVVACVAWLGSDGAG